MDKNMPSVDIPIIIRPSLKRACCGGDACRAAIYSQLLYAIARKVKSGGEYWYGTGKDIGDILDHSWGLSKIIKELNILVEQGFLAQRRNPQNGYDQTRQYLFTEKEGMKFREACQKSNVCVHQMGFGEDVRHLLFLTNAFIESNDCICQIQRKDSLDSVNAFVRSNRAIPKNTTKNTSENTTKRSDLLIQWYTLFDTLYRKKGYPDTFLVPRNEKNTEDISSLINAHATLEQASFVFEDIWNDSDAFWKQHRTISAVASQFAVRIGKYHQKQQAPEQIATSLKAVGPYKAFDFTPKPRYKRAQ